MGLYKTHPQLCIDSSKARRKVHDTCKYDEYISLAQKTNANFESNRHLCFRVGENYTVQHLYFENIVNNDLIGGNKKFTCHDMGSSTELHHKHSL